MAVGSLTTVEYPGLPCDTGSCPYEYDQNPERDIEGMPLIQDDPRTCHTYGHICPEYMEDLGLTANDLRIRAILHHGALARKMIKAGRWEKSEITEELLQRYEELRRLYPVLAREYE